MIAQTIIFLSVALIIISVVALILIDRTTLYMRNEFLDEENKALFKLLIEAFPDMYVFSHVSTLPILEPQRNLKHKEYKRIVNTLSRHTFLFALFTKDDDMRFMCAVDFAEHDLRVKKTQDYKNFHEILIRNGIITLEVSPIELPNKLVLRQQLNEKLDQKGYQLLPALADVLTEQIQQRTKEKGGLHEHNNLSPINTQGPVFNEGIPVFDSNELPDPLSDLDDLTNLQFQNHSEATETLKKTEAEITEKNDELLENTNLTQLQASMTFNHASAHLPSPSLGKKQDGTLKPLKAIKPIKSTNVTQPINDVNVEPVLTPTSPIESPKTESTDDLNIGDLQVNVVLEENPFQTLSKEEEVRILKASSIASDSDLFADKLAAVEKSKENQEKNKEKETILDRTAGLDEKPDSEVKRNQTQISSTNDMFYNLN